MVDVLVAVSIVEADSCERPLAVKRPRLSSTPSNEEPTDHDADAGHSPR